jgi:hypothetical protein
LATHEKQKNERISRDSNIGIGFAFVVSVLTFSIVIESSLSGILNSPLMAFIFGLFVSGVGTYVAMHMLVPRQFASIDTRLIHELAKRGLVEFQPVERDRELIFEQ